MVPELDILSSDFSYHIFVLWAIVSHVFSTFSAKAKQCHYLCQSSKDLWFLRKIHMEPDPSRVRKMTLWLSLERQSGGTGWLRLEAVWEEMVWDHFPPFQCWEAVCFCNWTCTSVINWINFFLHLSGIIYSNLNFWIIIQVCKLGRVTLKALCYTAWWNTDHCLPFLSLNQHQRGLHLVVLGLLHEL